MSSLTAIQKTLDAQKQTKALKIEPNSNDTSLFDHTEVGVLLKASNATVPNMPSGSITLKAGEPNRAGLNGGDITIAGGDGRLGGLGGNLYLSSGENLVPQGGTAAGFVLIKTGGSNLTSSSVEASGSILASTGDVGLDNKYSGMVLLKSGDPHTSANSGSGNLLIQSGGTENVIAQGKSGSVTLMSGQGGASISGDVFVKSGDTSSAQSGNVSVYTGDTTTADSGEIYLATGITEQGTSGDVRISTGENTTTGNSGVIVLKTGDTAAGNSGSYFLNTGNASNGNSGDFYFFTGNSPATSGSLDIRSGGQTGGAGTGATGSVTLRSGDSTNNNSGNVSIRSGQSNNSTSGSVFITSGSSSITSGNVSIATAGGGAISGDIFIATGDTTALPPGLLSLSTGDNGAGNTSSIYLTSVNASSNSGDIEITSGTAGGTRGEVKIDTNSVLPIANKYQRLLTAQADGVLKALGLQVLGYGQIDVSFNQNSTIHRLPLFFDNRTINNGANNIDLNVSVNNYSTLTETYTGVSVWSGLNWTASIDTTKLKLFVSFTSNTGAAGELDLLSNHLLVTTPQIFNVVNPFAWINFYSTDGVTLFGGLKNYDNQTLKLYVQYALLHI